VSPEKQVAEPGAASAGAEALLRCDDIGGRHQGEPYERHIVLAHWKPRLSITMIGRVGRVGETATCSAAHDVDAGRRRRGDRAALIVAYQFEFGLMLGLLVRLGAGV
jgi:hypothetical protein